MNIKRIILSAVVLTIFTGLFGMFTCGWLFNWVYKIPPTFIWRNMEDVTPLYWAFVNLINFVVAIIYTVVYAKIGQVFCGGKLRKGFMFGLLIWFVAILPGMLYTSAFMNVATEVIGYWLIIDIIKLPIIGIIIAYLCPIGNFSCSK